MRMSGTQHYKNKTKQAPLSVQLNDILVRYYITNLLAEQSLVEQLGDRWMKWDSYPLGLSIKICQKLVQTSVKAESIIGTQSSFINRSIRSWSFLFSDFRVKMLWLRLSKPLYSPSCTPISENWPRSTAYATIQEPSFPVGLLPPKLTRALFCFSFFHASY